MAIVDNLTVENSIDAPLSSQVNTALSQKYDASNPSGFQTSAQVTTAVNNAVTTANAFTTAQIASLVNASPAQLDTLQEIATALGNDPNFSTTITTGLANRVRVDTAAQGLSGTQKTNAKTNLDLQNVDNTSDISKPVSNATQTALNLKYDASNPLNFEGPTQLNTRDTNNRNRSNHTGSQTASTISDFSAASLAVVLTGISFLNSAVLATDTLLVGLGKLQGQITQLISDLANGLALKANNILSTIVFTNSALVSVTDSVEQGIGKLQAQLNKRTLLRQPSVLINASNATLVNIAGLAFAVTAGRIYKYDINIIHQSTQATTGPVFTLVGSGGAAGTLTARISAQTTATAQEFRPINALGALAIFPNVPANNTNYVGKIEGTFICTTSGTITPAFRSENNGQTITVQTDSTAIIRDVT